MAAALQRRFKKIHDILQSLSLATQPAWSQRRPSCRESRPLPQNNRVQYNINHNMNQEYAVRSDADSPEHPKTQIITAGLPP